MIPRECKRLAEVDFPIAVVSKHAVREKNTRHGHPSTLHLWWARRPLASCRAMVLALSLPDSCDENCPKDFTAKAREILKPMPGDIGTTDEDLRKALLRFIGDFASWDYAASPAFVETGRALVKAAHPDEIPLVVDPFAGGGSISLEALRLGCDTFASDLNPVACLILKTLLEDIPRYGPEFANEFRRASQEMRTWADAELSRFYPPDPDGARPIAYLWARTVRCESPNCGAEIPLVRSFWLRNKSDGRKALRYRIVRPDDTVPQVEFEIFSPTTGGEVTRGTVARAKATCPCCEATLAPERVRAQLQAQRGGADVLFDITGQRVGGARLLAVVTSRPGFDSRNYRLPTQRDYLASHQASEALDRVSAGRETDRISATPSEPLPPTGTLGFRVQRYGMTKWGDLFTKRQKLVLMTLCDACEALMSGNRVGPLVALTIGRQADYLSSLCTWHYHNREKVNHTFSRQALPFVTDFVETVYSGSGSGGWDGLFDWSEMAVRGVGAIGRTGSSALANAIEHTLPDQAAHIWFTDPPYYDAIPYADLSDFFFVWLKRALPLNALLHDPFDAENPLTPKAAEIVQDGTKSVGNRPKDRAFFEHAMALAFAEGRRVTCEDGIGSVVFAHKTTEG